MRIFRDLQTELPAVNVKLAGLEIVDTSLQFFLEAKLDRTVTTESFEIQLVLSRGAGCDPPPVVFDDLFPVQAVPEAALEIKELYNIWSRSEGSELCGF